MRRGGMRFQMGNVVDQVVPVGGRKCRPRRQQLVERHAKPINVGAGVRCTAKSLRRQIAQRAHHVSAVGQVAPFLFREAKIGDPDNAVRIEQQVGRLDVAVQNALAMGMRQRFGDL